jgi:asparagine synthase (glutamine-hydrolysing)
MRYFVVLINRDGRGVAEEVRRSYERHARECDLEFAWRVFDHVAVLTAWQERQGDPVLSTQAGQLAVGWVRLDNREELERRADSLHEGLTDIELVHRLIVQFGSRIVPELLGDFGFIAWNPTTRVGIAAADAMGMTRVYYHEARGLLAFASRAEALALEGAYDVRYLTELIGQCTPTPSLTAFADVRRLPAGTFATLDCSGCTLRRYWSPEAFEGSAFRPAMHKEAPQALRELLIESVRARLAPGDRTWAQLSGGLDSSSIVSVARHLTDSGLIDRKLAGTVTFVDLQGSEADERQYSDLVARHWGVRNETIVDPPFWFDGSIQPPRLDQPSESLPFHPRSQRLCALVRQAGGRVLLAGFGGDELFTGNTLFFADWLARGRLVAASREMLRWATQGRMSLWRLAYSNAILPLVPATLRHSKSVDQGAMLPWLRPVVAHRYEISERTFTTTGNQGRFGRKYHDAMLQSVQAIMSKLDAGVIGEQLDVRCPFLSRPIVEFALRLPAELCAQPHARKWVLREAMVGIVPEVVRTRVGKGAPTVVLVRVLSEQRKAFRSLMDDSILAELGIIDAQVLKTAIDTASIETKHNRDLSAQVHLTLMVEAWLRIRSGRWPWRGGSSGSTTHSRSAHNSRSTSEGMSAVGMEPIASNQRPLREGHPEVVHDHDLYRTCGDDPR